MNIPQEAVEAAYNAFQHPNRMLLNTSDGNRKGRLEAALEAALPAIEKEIRAQVGQELHDKLPVKLGETAASEYGWLSDLQYVSPETSAGFEMVELSDGGSIDISHIAEHAARIAEGANHD